MKASEARKLTAENAVKGIQTVYNYIQGAVNDGDSETIIAAGLIGGKPLAILKQLRADGYSVEYKSDQRDGDYYKISWNESGDSRDLR